MIGSFTLAPLRIIGLVTTLPVSLLIANIVKASAEKGARRSQVYKKWHQLFLIKLLLSLAKFQIFILGVSISHSGTPATRDEAPMLVLAPHSTFIDGLFLPYHGMITGAGMQNHPTRGSHTPWKIGLHPRPSMITPKYFYPWSPDSCRLVIIFSNRFSNNCYG